MAQRKADFRSACLNDGGSPSRASVKLVLGIGRSLLGADTADHNFGAWVAYAFHRTACQPSQRGELTSVCQGVRDRTLEQFRKFHSRPAGCECIVKSLNGSKNRAHS